MTSSSRTAERRGATVLRSADEVSAAARALDDAGWSWRRRGRIATRLWRTAGDLRLATYPLIQDRIKSWDVWHAAQHLVGTVDRDSLVFDVGAWQSEVLWALGRAGFRRLAGCDTDPRVVRMPGAERIVYRCADFFEVEIPPRSLGALTCLSVIEHGMDTLGFFQRAASLLAPGGRLLLTTDYWPDPIDTAGLEAFGRPWHICSRDDAERWIADAARLGLRPDGAVELDAERAPITWNGRSYTFLRLALVAEA